MALQIPAGSVAIAREEGVGASFSLREIKDELGFAAFLLHRVVRGNLNLPEGLAIRGHAVAEGDVICGVGDQSQAQHGREADDNQSLQEELDLVQRCGAHGEQL